MYTPSNFLEVYESIFPTLNLCSEDIVKNIKGMLEGRCRIDQISGRAKSVERFQAKAKKTNEDATLRYPRPLIEIQDQIGVRIVTYYLNDVDLIGTLINDYYEPIEELDKRPKLHDSFSYTGKHFILFVPEEVKKWTQDFQMPTFFELQIKTLFQHAWAEAEHDINYKTKAELPSEDKRLIAFSAAQAWGADKVFEELRQKYE